MFRFFNKSKLLYFSSFSDGIADTDHFSEYLENVINDCALMPKQTDELNILETLKQVISIDNEELVSILHVFFSPLYGKRLLFVTVIIGKANV